MLNVGSLPIYSMRILRDLLVHEFSDSKWQFPRTAPQQLAAMVRRMLSIVNRDDFRHFVRLLSNKARSDTKSNNRALLLISWSIHPFEYVDISKSELSFIKVTTLEE